MTRIAKQKKPKEKKVVGEEATPWAEMTKPVTDEKEKRREAKRLEKKRKRELKKVRLSLSRSQKSRLSDLFSVSNSRSLDDRLSDDERRRRNEEETRSENGNLLQMRIDGTSAEPMYGERRFVRLRDVFHLRQTRPLVASLSGKSERFVPERRLLQRMWIDSAFQTRLSDSDEETR